MKFSGFIFDMDGLLVDSEPYWQKVEKSVFASVGIELSDAMCSETVGLRLVDIVAHWYHKFPWGNKSTTQVEDEIISGMVSCYEKQLPFKPGANELLHSLCEKDGVSVALCSSSPLRLIETVVDGFGVRQNINVLHSSEFDEFGKPHPLPYLNCIKKLSLEPKNCVVFEDSTTGAISAKAAGTYVVTVPEGTYSEDKFSFCDEILSSLTEFKF